MRLDATNDARRKLSWRAFTRHKKVTDLSLLPCCSSSPRKYIQPSRYVASLWRQASHQLISVSNSSNHGWKTPNWTDESYPEDIAELLIESEGTQESADDEDDTDIRTCM